MKNYITLLFIFLMLPLICIAQEEDAEKKKVIDKPERPAFESATLIDNPTNVLFNKGTFEVMMQHRFGTIKKHGNDLAGIYGAANIRIAVSYAVIDRITVGFGTTKDKRLQDFNLKGALLRQTRSGKIPLSISYYGNYTIDARTMDKTDDLTFLQDRYSYFNQIIFARRFTPEFSAFISPSISHMNVVEEGMKNDMFGIAFGARYKVTPGTSIVLDYSQPLTKFDINNPNPGFSLGVEFGTSAHTFSIFASNYKGIVPQYNYMYNQHDFFGTGANGNDGTPDILIGFNITRNYNF